MASVNSSITSFVPGLIIRFGSLNFTAGDDGKLSTSHYGGLAPGQIGPGPDIDFSIGRGSVSVKTKQDNALRPEHEPLSPLGSGTIRSGKRKNALPESPFGWGDSSAESRPALGQDKGLPLGSGRDSGPRVVRVIHGLPLGQDSGNGESLLGLFDSPTFSGSSTGSCSPSLDCPREIFMAGNPSESELKRQADEAERRRLLEEAEVEIQRNRELQAKGRQVQNDIMRMNSAGADIFNTP